MRLIDVDKLMLKMEFVNDWSPKGLIKNRVMVSYDNVEAMPTVEAIPIEWIRLYVDKRAMNDGMDGYWHIWANDVLQMIDDWRKEKETTSDKFKVFATWGGYDESL